MTYATDRLIPLGNNYDTDPYVHPGYAPQASQMVPYQTYPLGQLPPASPLPGPFNLANVNLRQVLTVVVVVAIAAVILWQIRRMMTKGSTSKVERNAVVSRLSTKELAQRLYDRLESKGSRTNTATMRSLERLSR